MDAFDAIIAKSGKKDDSSPTKLVVEFLGLSKKFAEECEAGIGNPSYSAGKAISYFRAAEKLAKVASPAILSNPVFKTLLERLTPLSVQYRNAPPKQYFSIERPVKEAAVLEEIEDITPEPPHAKTGFTDMGKFNQLVLELKRRGTPEEECVRIAFSIYDETKPIKEMLKRILK